MEKYNENEELMIISMEDVEAVEVDWLWYPYIPYGKITIIQGDPGGGKTTFVLQLAAILSRGDKLPCSDEKCKPISIIYQSAEDGLNDTIKPRLIAANADCTRIKVIDESKEPLSMLDERIEQAINKTGARLIILDPIQAYLGRVDMHRANEVRPILKRLGALADEYNCAFLLIGHMNKNGGVKSSYRGLGSIDFQAAARSVLIVGKVDDNNEKRAVAHDKSSLAPEGKTIGFELGESNGFTWLGYLDITVKELLSCVSKETKIQMAEKLLEDMLKDGQVEYQVILNKANSIGIKLRTLEQAKKNLGVKSKRMGKCWYWNIP